MRYFRIAFQYVDQNDQLHTADMTQRTRKRFPEIDLALSFMQGQKEAKDIVFIGCQRVNKSEWREE